MRRSGHFGGGKTQSSGGSRGYRGGQQKLKKTHD